MMEQFKLNGVMVMVDFMEVMVDLEVVVAEVASSSSRKRKVKTTINNWELREMHRKQK
jgi:hypothetical protein